MKSDTECGVPSGPFLVRVFLFAKDRGACSLIAEMKSVLCLLVDLLNLTWTKAGKKKETSPIAGVGTCRWSARGMAILQWFAGSYTTWFEGHPTPCLCEHIGCSTGVRMRTISMRDSLRWLSAVTCGKAWVGGVMCMNNKHLSLLKERTGPGESRLAG